MVMTGARSSREDFDVVIVGAGFAGLACARSVALRGMRALVIERSRAPGRVIRTTGLLVKEAAERWEVPARLTRRIRGVRLYAPSLRQADLDAAGYYFLATDTAALMQWLTHEAQRAGATVRYNQRFQGASRRDEWIELDGHKTRARYLVGADGPNSAVAATFGLGRNTAFLAGVETEYRGVGGVDPDRLHCFVDSRLARGYIGWVVPGFDGVTQVGLAARRPDKLDLKGFLRKIGSLFDFGPAQAIARRGGLIPVGGRVSPFAAPGVLLVGDAAGLVSPLTAGGIHTALESGWCAAHAIADFLQDQGHDPARVAAKAYPRFVLKRGLRRLADLPPPNVLYDAILGTTPMRLLASAIYFHRRPAATAREHESGYSRPADG
jgi:digeranylgeranylglycerophospholipid reductase